MESEITTKGIESRILTIRNQQVMIDRDLAELYGVETRILNQTVKRNIERFPENFMFQLTREETDEKVKELFSLIDKYNVNDTQGIFFQGQIFDAYAKFESFIAQAQKEIILIDNFIDLSILERFSKKKPNVNITIWTAQKTPLSSQDIQQFNTQNPTLTVNHTSKMHDRFLIIDNKILYHIGASLKDLGKKCFAFEIPDKTLIPHLLAKL